LVSRLAHPSIHVVFVLTTRPSELPLRLSLNLCVPHQCPCGAADYCGLERFTHGLACKLAPGGMARHGAQNDYICRALSSAGISSTEEPEGLLRSNDKRPGGLSFIPGKNRIPATVIHPLADSYLNKVSLTAGDATELAAKAGRTCKIKLLTGSVKIRRRFFQLYSFQPIAFKTLGAPNCTAVTCAS